jgi:hypothetical protein
MKDGVMMQSRGTARRCAGLTMAWAAGVLLLLLGCGALRAQQRPAVTAAAHAPAGAPAARAGFAGMPPGPANARAQAPFDPSGYWVSIITESWRFRMLVPGKGDYDEIPFTLAAKQFADAWSPVPDEAAGQQCKAYGAGVIMWLPERLHIGWQDDNTLRVDTDAGMQTRLLRFNPTAADAAAPPSLQGYSVARWVMHGGVSFGAPPAPRNLPRYGSIEVLTDHLLGGYLRKNGVPYGDQATLTEYWEQHSAPGGTQWLIVTSVLKDPKYLAQPFVFTPDFRQEPDGSKWHPAPCSLRF